MLSETTVVHMRRLRRHVTEPCAAQAVAGDACAHGASGALPWPSRESMCQADLVKQGLKCCEGALGHVGSPPARNHPIFSKQRHAPDTCVTRPHSSAPGAGGAPAAGAAASPAPRSVRSIVGRLPWTTCARAASSARGAAFVLCICGATCATQARPTRKAEHALDVHLLSRGLEQAAWRSLR